MPKIFVQSAIRQIEQSTPPGAARAQALEQLGNRLALAMTETKDPHERYRLRGLQHHVLRLAEDARRATL